MARQSSRAEGGLTMWIYAALLYVALSVPLALLSRKLDAAMRKRAGHQTVPAGEIEACQVLSVSRFDTLRYIVVPQGMRIALPALMGFAILIFQTSLLAFVVAAPELMQAANSIGSTTFKYLSSLSLAGLLYLAITIPTTWLVGFTERRMSRHLVRTT